MTIIWSDEALDDLSSLRSYISKDSPKAAQRMALTIISAVENLLADNSELGRAGRVPGTRELVIPRTPYVIPYRVASGTVQILRVYHRARRWPDRL